MRLSILYWQLLRKFIPTKLTNVKNIAYCQRIIINKNLLP